MRFLIARFAWCKWWKICENILLVCAFRGKLDGRAKLLQKLRYGFSSIWNFVRVLEFCETSDEEPTSLWQMDSHWWNSKIYWETSRMVLGGKERKNSVPNTICTGTAQQLFGPAKLPRNFQRGNIVWVSRYRLPWTFWGKIHLSKKLSLNWRK